MKKIGFFLGPGLLLGMLLLPAPAALSIEAWRVLALSALVLVWWITEAVPIAVTSLLPMVGLPLLGIGDMKAAATPYASPIVYLFMGGFMLALSLEKWHLHRRIALNIVKLTGTNANGIILGFLLATAFLSMWISNTATAIMMLPIALSVVDLLTRGAKHYPPEHIRAFAVSMMLVVAYGASIGGTATIIGTPPNVVFAGFIRENYQVEVTFLQWMAVGTPFAIGLLIATYFMLVHLIFPNRLGKFEGATELIESEVAALGTPTRAERLTFLVFVCTAGAWIFREPINQVLPFRIGDEEIAILAMLALFVIPVNWKKQEFLLEWKDTEKLPWGILLLFGGGLSLAGALKDVGLIDLIGNQFKDASVAGFWIILGLSTVSLYLTEVMSNVALVTVFLPVVGGVAVGMGIPPVMMCVPVTLAASCAFMLPMGTPPNAIVFASGHIRITDMVRAGFWLNLITVIFTALLAQWLLPLVFGA